MIRAAAAVFVLLTGALANAQTVFPEVRSWSMETPAVTTTLPSPALSITPEAGGFVLAWSAGAAQSRVSVARLDGSLRVIDGQQRELPAYFGDGYDATDPQMIATTSGYAMTWLERKRSVDKQPDYVIFARLSPAFEMRSVMQLTPTSPDTRVRLFRGADDDAIVAVIPFVYTVHSDGGVVTNVPSADVDDIAATAQHTAWVTNKFKATTCPGGFPSLCYDPASFEARAYVDSAVVDSVTIFTPPLPLPTAFSITGDDSGLLVTWIGSRNEIFASRVPRTTRPDRETMDHPLNLGTMSDTPPYTSLSAAAFDGERWLVVWQQKGARAGHDIVGSVIGERPSQPFTIAATTENEQRPTVVAVASGVFLVGYEVVDADGLHRQLAGRYVSFLPLHPRAGGK